MRARLAIFVALTCSGSTWADEFDSGGRVGAYLAWVELQDREGDRVVIDGVCASACTLKLSAQRACVTPGAELLFHAARDDNGRIDPLATLVMLHEFPRRIRAWLLARDALASSAFTRMSGAQAISLGTPNCGTAAAHRESNRLQQVRIK